MCIYINIEYWPEHSFNKHHNIETLLGFPIFVFTFRPSSIYVISMWTIFHFHLHFQYDSLWINTHYRRVTGRGRCAFPALFRKLEKSAPLWGNIVLVLVICGKNFSFKMQFFRVSWQKDQNFFPARLFFLVL